MNIGFLCKFLLFFSIYTKFLLGKTYYLLADQELGNTFGNSSTSFFNNIFQALNFLTDEKLEEKSNELIILDEILEITSESLFEHFGLEKYFFLLPRSEEYFLKITGCPHCIDFSEDNPNDIKVDLSEKVLTKIFYY